MDRHWCEEHQTSHDSSLWADCEFLDAHLKIFFVKFCVYLRNIGKLFTCKLILV